MRLIAAVTCAVISVASVNRLMADDIRADQLFPETTIGFVEIQSPPELIKAILDHPLSNWVQGLKEFSAATKTEAYRSFLTGRKFFEVQIGAEYRPAIEALTEHGMALGLDSRTSGAALLVRGRDVTTMENFRAKILELTRLNKNSKQPEPYREIPIYKLQEGGGAVVNDWFVVTNNGDLGKLLIDRILDGNTPTGAALADSHAYQRYQSDNSATVGQVRAFADLQAIREAGHNDKVFTGKADNPLAELLLGGLQSVIQKADYLAATLQIERTSAELRVNAPFQADWIPEERSWFFGDNATGRAPALPVVPETLLTFATYRDVSQMWLRAGDLFDERMNDQLAEADSNLSTIFAGRDFGEDILGSLRPELGFVVARQSFDMKAPVPTIKLPAFAFVGRLRDPDTMRSELRRTFQSAIGFFNIVGAQNGQPQLEMDMQKSEALDLITSRYVPDKSLVSSTSAPLIYNFSPSVAFAEDRFVLASTAQLAEKLATAPDADDQSNVNTQISLNAAVAGAVLTDNRDQLISQNMLEEGKSREEAEAAINLLIQTVQRFRRADLTLENADNSMGVRLLLRADETAQ
jgi:hypothetical protein